MPASALPTLLRLRRAAREESQAAVRRAEDDRDTQAQRLAGIRTATASARENFDPSDVAALVGYHEFRARQEVQERREAARLVQRERELEVKRTQHAGRVRDELALETVIERKQVEAEREELRRDNARMDELGRRSGSHE